MTAVGVSAPGIVAADRTHWSRWAGVSGVLFAVLLAASVSLTVGMPDAKNAIKVRAWDVKHTGLLGLSFVLTTAAVIVGLCFLIWLHSLLTRDGGGWLGNLFLVGTVVFAMTGLVAAGVHASLNSDAKHLSTASLQLMASLDQNFNFPMGSAALAVLFLAAGFLIRRSGVLPGWLSWVSWVFALLAATIFLGFIALIGSALWLLVVGVYLTARPPVASPAAS